ncbi:MAG: hypothetical protein AAFQ82_18335 [Myxococcota bacterium]
MKWSVDDLVAEARAIDPALLKKITLLTDCMSAVAVPDGSGGFAVDFTTHVEEALQVYADAGIRLATVENLF